ncbi:MAG TPA: DNA/RNA nuclease SfsA [Clostridia bacterium]|nr:DNA/RNA nuclease SfsA [Clostridia bacterium]
MIPAHFIRRNNRFVAEVEVDGNKTLVYVPTTSRLTELFFRGNKVLLKDHGKGKRKYRYSIEGVLKGDYFLSINSTLPNKLFKESYQKGELPFLGLEGEVQSEVRVSDKSRLDFKIGNTYIEVKGVTLEQGGISYFPGSPTTRGIKHLHELAKLSKSSRAMIVYIVLVKCQAFSLNPKDKAYKETFLSLEDKVELFALAYEDFPKPIFKGELPFLLE